MDGCRPNLLVLRVRDLRLAERFYAALGLVFERHRHGRGPVHAAAVVDGFVFELYPCRAGDAPTSGVRLGWAVADLAGAIERAVAVGGTVVAKPCTSPSGLRAVVLDPDGHKVELLAASGAEMAQERGA